MKKVIRLTESELTKLIKKIVTKKNLVNEQLTLLAAPLNNIDIGPSKVNSKAIVLRYNNPKTKKQEYIRYNITATYTGVNFDVDLRNIKRESNGDLTAEALPSNWLAKKALSALVPKENKTSDGWLMVKVTKKQLEEAIVKLKQNRGQSATMQAGEKEDGSPSGVEIQLTLAETGK